MEPEEIKLSDRSISLMALDLASRVATVELDTNHDHESVDDIISSTLSRMSDCIFGDDDDGVVDLDDMIYRCVEEFDALSMIAGMKLMVEFISFNLRVMDEESRSSEHGSIMVQNPENN